jgi:hypothetical protein
MEALQNPSDQELIGLNLGKVTFKVGIPHTSNRPQHASSLKAIEKLKDNSANP